MTSPPGPGGEAPTDVVEVSPDLAERARQLGIKHTVNERLIAGTWRVLTPAPEAVPESAPVINSRPDIGEPDKPR